ncbi:hypothetical protein LCGC14_0797930 [marine sediment metagenome]|uniref:Uncharacterized protein n=1 Tax=marine sediment metagenome TaxID=412755 RepID=A0A0F9QAE1_9ZZZZ
MVEQHAINFVPDEHIRLIQIGEKTAFFRMESKILDSMYEEFKNDKEILLITGEGRMRAWLYLTYMDVFKWKEIKNDAEIILRGGFVDKKELKDFLKRLYGIELEEDPFLYYIEFDYVPFPKLPK